MSALDDIEPDLEPEERQQNVNLEQSILNVVDEVQQDVLEDLVKFLSSDEQASNVPLERGGNAGGKRKNRIVGNGNYCRYSVCRSLSCSKPHKKAQIKGLCYKCAIPAGLSCEKKTAEI